MWATKSNYAHRQFPLDRLEPLEGTTVATPNSPGGGDSPLPFMRNQFAYSRRAYIPQHVIPNGLLTKSPISKILLTPLAKKRFVTDHTERNEPTEQDTAAKTATESGSKNTRSLRGLRVLSLKVRDIVYRNRSMTYKEVADVLIK